LSPDELILQHGRLLLRQEPFHTGEVHAMDTSASPVHATRELLNVSLVFDVPGADHTDIRGGTWAELVRPNLPWAEEHFRERVSGVPYNPAPSHVRWPWAQHNAKHQDGAQQFSHTYPERFWPKHAHQHKVPRGEMHNQTCDGLRGIRYAYGDLMDVVDLLDRSLYTRQAYLPVWFPEDTGSQEQVRVPCTLGYHFIVRPQAGSGQAPIDRLHMVYYIRSCDYVRHFRDDIYMAGRLAQWMAEMLNGRGHTVFPDSLTMHITSLHSFVGDDWRIREDVKTQP
jgi:hypothetical protein